MKKRLVIATLIFILLYTVTAWSNEKLYGNEVFPESQVEDIREEVYKKSTVKVRKIIKLQERYRCSALEEKKQ